MSTGEKGNFHAIVNEIVCNLECRVEEQKHHIRRLESEKQWLVTSLCLLLVIFIVTCHLSFKSFVSHLETVKNNCEIDLDIVKSNCEKKYESVANERQKAMDNDCNMIKISYSKQLDNMTDLLQEKDEYLTYLKRKIIVNQKYRPSWSEKSDCSDDSSRSSSWLSQFFKMLIDMTNIRVRH